MHAATPAARPTLLVEARSVPGRFRQLQQALELDPHTVVLPCGEPLPELLAYGAVILDGPRVRLTEADIQRLDAFLLSGGRLVAIGAAPADGSSPLAQLLGVVSGPPRPHAELLVRAAVPADDLLQRLDPEFALLDAFTPLHALRDGARPLLQVVWTMREETLAFVRDHGDGRILVTSVGGSADALGSPTLRAVLRRALRPGRAERRSALGLAVVGYGPYGGMGQLHAAAARQVSGWRFAAVCDRSPERLAVAQRDFPDVRPYHDAELLAADDTVDVVVVATPPATHAALARAFLEAGKHVVCEKPLCLTLAEADDLLMTARSVERVLTVHQNRRWDADYLAIRRALEAGLLGELFNVETFVGGFDHPCRLWHSDRDVSGGAIYDWGSHYLDWTVQLLGGPPASVSATAHKRVWHDVTNFDQVRVRLLWDDGREAEFLHSDVAAVRRPKFYLQGTAATLVGHYRPLVSERLDAARGYVREESHHAEAPARLLLARYESGIGITETPILLQPPRPFAFHRNLADHLLLGEPLAVTPESVRPVIAVLEAASRSADDGGTPVALSGLELTSANGSHAFGGAASGNGGAGTADPAAIHSPARRGGSG